jgi:hypothetical protein
MATKGKEIIKRYFSDEVFEHIRTDFGFLVQKVIQSGFEYDLQIRDNYFNLYYRGNSIGKVEYVKKTAPYKVSIHSKFVSEDIEARFQKYIPSGEKKATYVTFHLPKDQLRPLFSTANLSSMGQKVKEVNYQEEIAFEQRLMTDNVKRPDFIIIDRQVRDKLCRTRLDLLALTQKEANEYQFCVIEVKLGNNKELKDHVIDQLTEYVGRITNNFDEYKRCYEKNLKQKQALGLIDPQRIKIVPEVWGLVVVGHYSRIANKYIEELQKRIKSLKVQGEIKVLHLTNTIKLKDVKSTT